MSAFSGSPGPGGFIQENDADMMSPQPNIANTALARTAADLPHPRARALVPGSAKENLVRRYASERILNISRRFIKKFAITDPSDTVVGYRSMGELCADVNVVLNSLWKSGTPALQIQYLLNIGSELMTWMDGFAPSPRATLALLRKLDYCFASLLGGEDLQTRAVLPGFEQGVRRSGMTQTDMVRCRSIAEQSRVLVVDVFQRGPPDPLDEARTPARASRTPAQSTPAQPTSTQSTPSTKEDKPVAQFQETLLDDTDAETSDTETETEARTVTRETTAEPGFEDYDEEEEEEVDEEEDWEDDEEQMGVARVYEYTLVKLGQVLGEGYGRIGDFKTPAQPCGSNPANKMELDGDASMDDDIDGYTGPGENDDDEY